MILQVQCYSETALSSVFQYWHSLVPTYIYLHTTKPNAITLLSSQYPSLHPFALASWLSDYHRSLRKRQSGHQTGAGPTTLVMHSLQGIVDRADALSQTVPATTDPSLRVCYETIKYLANELTLAEPVLPPISITVPLEDIKRDLRAYDNPHPLWEEYAEKLHLMQQVPTQRDRRLPNVLSVEAARSMTRTEFIAWVNRLSAPPDKRPEWAIPNTIKA